jgi:hypothetical protein
VVKRVSWGGKSGYRHITRRGSRSGQLRRSLPSLCDRQASRSAALASIKSRPLRVVKFRSSSTWPHTGATIAGRTGSGQPAAAACRASRRSDDSALKTSAGQPPLLGITAVARWPDAAAIRRSMPSPSSVIVSVLKYLGTAPTGVASSIGRSTTAPFPAPIYQAVQVRRIRCRIRQVGGDTHPAFDRRRHIGRRWGGRPLGPTLGSLWNPRREIVDIRGP